MLNVIGFPAFPPIAMVRSVLMSGSESGLVFANLDQFSFSVSTADDSLGHLTLQRYQSADLSMLSQGPPLSL